MGRRERVQCVKGGIIVLLLLLYLQVPDNDTTVDATGADLSNGIRRTRVCADSADRVLVDGLELSVIDGLAAEIHLSKHVESRLIALVGRTRL